MYKRQVLDPEQNAMFSDHYIEEPYDLSKVLFIATANYLENIPNALRDRLEIIELSSYTELEKIEIAKRHLVPKQIKENGLKNSQLKIDDDMISYLIRYYTRESGVRQLERTIATVCRKSVLAILKAVSYTHLDVYKSQVLCSSILRNKVRIGPLRMRVHTT